MTAKKIDQLPAVTTRSYMPDNFVDAMEICKELAKSDFVPKAYKNKPGDIFACVQFGAERGIPPMQALQGIAVINGRPSVYGDLLLAMVQRHKGLMVHHKEYFEHSANGATVAAVCEVKRRGDEEIHKVRFSVDDAARANLLKKPGTWQEYPKRMLMWRARGFALRDKFADALGGLISVEEALDMPGGETPAEVMEHIRAAEPEIDGLESVSSDAPSKHALDGSERGAEDDAAHLSGQVESDVTQASDSKPASGSRTLTVEQGAAANDIIDAKEIPPGVVADILSAVGAKRLRDVTQADYPQFMEYLANYAG